MLTGDSLDAVTVESGKVRYLPMWVDFGLRGCCKQNMSCTKVDRGNGFRDFLLDMFLDFFVGLNFSFSTESTTSFFHPFCCVLT